MKGFGYSGDPAASDYRSIKMWLKVTYFCPTRMVSEYHDDHDRVFFCEFPSRWFTHFDTKEADSATIFPEHEAPDLVYENGKLFAPEKAKEAR